MRSRREDAEERAAKRAEQERADKEAANRLYQQTHSALGRQKERDPWQSGGRKEQDDPQLLELRKALETALSAEKWSEVSELSSRLEARQKVLESEEKARCLAEAEAMRYVDMQRKACVPEDAKLKLLGLPVLKDLCHKLAISEQHLPRDEGAAAEQLRSALRALRDTPLPPGTDPKKEGSMPPPPDQQPVTDPDAGVYRLLSNADLTPTLRARESLMVLQAGDLVRIDQVVKAVELRRVRGRVVYPSEGWISMRNTEDGFEWVKRDLDAWPSSQSSLVTLAIAAVAAAGAAKESKAKPKPKPESTAPAKPPVPKYVENGLVKAARRIEFESGKVVEKGTIGEAVKVPGSPAQVRISGVLFTAEEGEVEPILLPPAKQDKALDSLPKGIAKEAAEQERLSRATRAERFTEGCLVRTLKKLEFESGKTLEAGTVGEAVKVPGIPATVRMGGLVFSAHGDGDIVPYDPPGPAAVDADEAVKRPPLTAGQRARLEDMLGWGEPSADLGFATEAAPSDPQPIVLDPKEAVPLRRHDSASRARSRSRRRRRRREESVDQAPRRRFGDIAELAAEDAREDVGARPSVTFKSPPRDVFPPPSDHPAYQRDLSPPRASVRGGSFSVIVSPAGESGVDINVRDMTTHDTILALKRRVENINGVPPAQQCLVQHTSSGASRRLDDRCTLASYGVRPGERLILTAAQGRLPIMLRNAQGRTMKVSAHAQESVLTLKQRVHSVTNVPISRQVLLLHGEELADRRSLAQSGISAGATIDLHDRGSRGQVPRRGAGVRGAPLRLCILDTSAGPRGSTVVVHVATGDSVTALKQQVSARTGLPVSAFTLTHNGVRLGEGLRLRECGLRDSSKLRLEYITRDAAVEDAGVAELESRVVEMRRSVEFLTSRSDGLSRAVEQMADRFVPGPHLGEIDARTRALLSSCRGLREQAEEEAREDRPSAPVREGLRMPAELAASIAREREPGIRISPRRHRSFPLPADPPPGSPTGVPVSRIVPPQVTMSPPRITVSPPTARGEPADAMTGIKSSQTPFERRLAMLRELHARERENIDRHSTITQLSRRLEEMDRIGAQSPVRGLSPP